MAAVYPTSWKIEMELAGSGAGWTNISADVFGFEPIKWSYGIQGSSLDDRVAAPGSLSFALNNSNRNSATTLGYYSPDHASCRSGFAVGINVRFTIVYAATTYYKFHGRLSYIDPKAGQYGQRATMCLVHDYMDEIDRAKIKRIAIQIDKRADEILTTVVNAIPRQPVSRSFGVGRSTYVYALDSSPEEGLGVMEECQRVAKSEVGFVYVKGDTAGGGKLVFESRTDRAGKNTNLATFDNSMMEFGVGRDRDDIVTRLQVVNHPKRKDTSNQILFSLRDPNVSEDTAISLQPGEAKTLVCPYTDPNDRNHRIGAVSTSMVAPVVTTDYLMFANADGTGSNLSADLSIAVTFGATAAYSTLTNGGTSSGFVTFFQLRGPGIYDEQDVIWEREDATARDAFGEQTVTYDMPYESDPSVGEGASRYFLALLKADVSNADEGIRFLANSSDALMTQAMTREPGDRIGIAEAATGMATTNGFFIQSCEGQLSAGSIVSMRWGLAPASRQVFWLLGTAGASELGATTYLGF